MKPALLHFSLMLRIKFVRVVWLPLQRNGAERLDKARPVRLRQALPLVIRRSQRDQLAVFVLEKLRSQVVKVVNPNDRQIVKRSSPAIVRTVEPLDHRECHHRERLPYSIRVPPKAGGAEDELGPCQLINVQFRLVVRASVALHDLSVDGAISAVGVVYVVVSSIVKPSDDLLRDTSAMLPPAVVDHKQLRFVESSDSSIGIGINIGISVQDRPFGPYQPLLVHDLEGRWLDPQWQRMCLWMVYRMVLRCDEADGVGVVEILHQLLQLAPATICQPTIGGSVE
mmetsp:Transcript_6394/g.18839  ORF Transcript_6394/g.18839 Transcript_6394/m.18839 type:complete len:283 (+) Transcript_6394:144-992(+)